MPPSLFCPFYPLPKLLRHLTLRTSTSCILQDTLRKAQGRCAQCTFWAGVLRERNLIGHLPNTKRSARLPRHYVPRKDS
jgi:hypothetical protein